MAAPILLNPGPVTLSDRVRQALLHADVCHRELEFAALTREILDRLGAVYPVAADDYTAVLLTGSGTCAVEAMLATLVPRDGKALVLTNGVYGERMAEMVRLQGKPIAVVTAPWQAPLDLAAAATHLAADPAITHMVAVHHETTTGRLNDLAALGTLCKAHDVALLVDAVSSFGAEQLMFAEWNVAAVAATANKCLHSAPGISFVLARTELLFERPSAANSVYLDLQRYARAQRDGFSPFTQAVHVAYALREAAAEFADAGGVAARHALYRARSNRIRTMLQALDVELLLRDDEYGSALTAFRLPPGYSYAAIHHALKDAGFVIYAGQGAWSDTIFRIANMGAIEPADLDRLEASCRKIFRPAAAPGAAP